MVSYPSRKQMALKIPTVLILVVMEDGLVPTEMTNYARVAITS